MLRKLYIKHLIFYFFISGSVVTCWAIEWVKPSNIPTSYLFAPGIHSSERQIAKYCDGYIATTGQLVYSDNKFVVIGDTVRAVNFPEIVLDEAELESLDKISQSPTFLAKLYNFIVRWRNKSNDLHEKITVEKKAISGPNVEMPTVKLANINLGQEADINQLSAAYDQHVQALPDDSIVFYGTSRGAATGFNFLSTQYQKKDIKNIKLAVFEGCFDSVDNLLAQKYPWIQNHSGLQNLARKCFNYIYPGHNFDGIEPIKVVKDFPKDIPVLFVTSKIDNVVPCKTTWSLYRALKQAGHPHVYLLELKHSSHPCYMIDDEYDKMFYESTVHAFYKKFNAPYNPKLIEFGQTILKNCQPK